MNQKQTYNRTSLVKLFVFVTLKEPAHKSHLLESKTSLVELFVYKWESEKEPAHKSH